MTSDDDGFEIAPCDVTIRVVTEDDGQFILVENDVPVADANEFLVALRVRGLSPRTVRAYCYDLLLLYRWMRSSAKTLRRLAAADLVEFIAVQRKLGAEPRSINRRLGTARLLYRFWMTQDLDAGARVSSPAPHYKGPGRDHSLGLHQLTRRGVRQLRVREPRKLVEPLTPEQVRSFLR